MPTAPHRAIASLLFLALPLVTVGCSINVDKGANGEEKKVKIDTPLGNIHVNADKPSGSLGIALYPGATSQPDHDGDKDADVQLGFGEWKMRVQVAHFKTSDDRDKVLAYYRKSLSRYGEVIECRDNQPVGSPVRTSEGLTCSENEKNHDVKTDIGDHDLTLRAGSKRHQHIVAFEKENADSAAGPTQFTLIALDLPAETWKKDRQTD